MRVAVVGGGLIGLGIAWRLAQRRCRVTVFDCHPERAASRVGAGILMPAGGRVSHDQLLLKRASAELYPDFVEELESLTGLAAGYRACGMLTVAFEPGAQEALEGLATCLTGLGVTVERLTAAECRQREPALSESVAGGLVTPDHQVDPERLLDALQGACAGAGVEFLAEEVTAVKRDSVLAVQAREFDRVVVAGGAWLSRLLELPVFPVKGEVVHLRTRPGLLNGNLRLQKEDTYLANRGDGRVVVGSTEEEVGFDQTVTAVTQLHRRAARLVPELAQAEVLGGRAGLRPKVADGLPLLGEFHGVVVAGAHHRNGILLTPITAQVVTDLVCRSEVLELARPFSPERHIFDRRKERLS